MNWQSMTLMLLGSTLWILLLAVLVWAMIRWLNHRTTSAVLQTQTPSRGNPTAGDILSQRYARGEIDVTTFEQMREKLETVNNAHQRSWVAVQRSTGEKLFDGGTSGT